MKVLHILTSGHTGGIESLCRDIGQYGKLMHVFCFLTAGGVVCEDMQRKGMNVTNLEKYGSRLSVRKICAIHKIAKNCDVIIVHHGESYSRLCYIILKIITHKYAVSMNHSCYGDESQIHYKGLKLLVYRKIIQKSLDVSDAVWFVSHAGESSCKLLYKIDESKCRVIYNGISPDFIEKAHENRIINSRPYNITYIGRLERIKGVHMLIKAFASLCQQNDVILSIVGEGTARDELEALVNSLDIGDKVTFYGQQVDVHPFLSKASIFVYPSTCEEVFGISLVEAMAYGLPCIANNGGGLSEIIHVGDNGFLISEPNEENIAMLINKVIGMYESGEIKHISYNAQKTADKFSIVNTCEQIESELVGVVR